MGLLEAIINNVGSRIELIDPIFFFASLERSLLRS